MAIINGTNGYDFLVTNDPGDTLNGLDGDDDLRGVRRVRHLEWWPR
jgi:hypothetical protein